MSACASWPGAQSEPSVGWERPSRGGPPSAVPTLICAGHSPRADDSREGEGCRCAIIMMRAGHLESTLLSGCSHRTACGAHARLRTPDVRTPTCALPLAALPLARIMRRSVRAQPFRLPPLVRARCAARHSYARTCLDDELPAEASKCLMDMPAVPQTGARLIVALLSFSGRRTVGTMRCVRSGSRTNYVR